MEQFRKSILFFGVLGFGMAAMPAVSGAIPLEPTFGVRGGISVPSGNLNDTTKKKEAVGVFAEIGLPLIPFTRINVTVDRLSLNGEADDRNLRLFPATAALVLDPPIPFFIHPYLLGGAGVVQTRLSLPNTAVARSLQPVTVIGGGVYAKVKGPLRIGLDARHLIIHDKGLTANAETAKLLVLMGWIGLGF